MHAKTKNVAVSDDLDEMQRNFRSMLQESTVMMQFEEKNASVSFKSLFHGWDGGGGCWSPSCFEPGFVTSHVGKHMHFVYL